VATCPWCGAKVLSPAELMQHDYSKYPNTPENRTTLKKISVRRDELERLKDKAINPGLLGVIALGYNDKLKDDIQRLKIEITDLEAELKE
jgi:hypothetical protein